MEQNLCYNCFHTMDEQTAVCPLCGHDPAADQDKYPLALPPGTILIGQYILGHVLGQGGFGITYVAQDHKSKGLVAIKEFFPDTLSSRTAKYAVTAYSGEREDNFQYGKKCFLDEAKTLAEFMEHPNVVHVIQYFEENGTAYFVMEYIHGTTLQEHITAEGGKISWQKAVDLLLPIMDALGAVHAKGIVHRDVTPDNIVITDDGCVKLLDFGAARYTLGNKSHSLDIVLKHGFAPKEQYTRRGRQGPYTDIYSLAATLYYITTGRMLPDSIDRMEEDDLILPSSLGVDIPPKAEDALVKALSVRHEDRYQNMQEFKVAITSVPTPDPVPDPSPKDDILSKLAACLGLKEIPKWSIWACSAAAVLVLVLCVFAISGRSSTADEEENKSDPAVLASADDISDADESAAAVRVNSLTDTILDVPERGTLTYSIAIQPQYEALGPFSEDLAPAKKDGKWGYINKNNETVISFEYEMAWLFSEGYAVVATEISTAATGQDGYKIGFIDNSGSYTPFVRNESPVWIFAEDYADQSDLVFHNNRIVFSPAGTFNRMFDTNGTEIDFGVTPDSAYYWVPNGPSNEGLVPLNGGPNYYGWATPDGTLVAFRNINGEETNQQVFPGSFNQSLACVTIAQYNEEGYFVSYDAGFVNRDLDMVIDAVYGAAYVIGGDTIQQYFGDSGLAMLSRDGKFGAIDKNGQTEILFRYEELMPEEEGMILFKVDGKYGYLDGETRVVAIPAQFEMASNFENGFAVAYDGQKAFLIDRTGTEIPGADTLDPSTYFQVEDDGTISRISSPSEYVVIEDTGLYGFGHIEYYPELPGTSSMDAWAYDEAASAIAEGLVPISLQNLYRYNITRSAMCELIVETLEKILGTDIKDLVKARTGNSFSTYVKLNGFQDSASRSVIACNALGIVTGVSETEFDPYVHITRETAAAILQRTARLLNMDVDHASVVSFSDQDDVAQAFIPAVNYVLETGIMDLGDDGTFDPLGNFRQHRTILHKKKVASQRRPTAGKVELQCLCVN